jgi:hypothetical protein
MSISENSGAEGEIRTRELLRDFPDDVEVASQQGPKPCAFNQAGQPPHLEK